MSFKPSDFTHLHVHSEYSMLDGLNKLPPLVAKAAELGQKSLAITDHGGMYGCLHFYNACRHADIKPIIGVEAYMARFFHFEKQSKMGSDQFHITLLAQNDQGYRNLMHLVSQANLHGFSYKPRIDKDMLFKHNQGVIATTGCMGSLFNWLLRNNEEKEAHERISEFKEVFKDRFYVEIQRHPNSPELDELNVKLLEIARQYDLPIVATNDVHYLTKDDAEAQDALICVQTRKLISDEKRMSMMDSPDYYLKSTAEMVETFHDLPEAIRNTQVIAEQCNVDIKTGQLIFPKFPLPKGETEDSYFEKLIFKGAKQKLGEITQKTEERLRYEMDIIKDKGYSAYFLITQDFVNWAKEQGIAVGPGRGSAAGSLVSYSLNITSINPFEHKLPFERFLNPERPTPPDIDLDFADNRRDEVIQYVSDKFGADHVAHVITFGRMEARVSIRDIGRVLGMPYEDPDVIAKLIPNVPGTKTSLDTAVKTVPDLAQYYKQPKFKKLIDLAKRVEGVIRHSSVHAAALIIADKPLDNYTPIQKDNKSGKMITQYDMYALDCNVSDEAIGLLKFDFLGLRNLSIIQTALELIKKTKNIEIDIDNIPLDDPPTFQLLTEGQTMGVFQLESSGMRRVAKSLKPTQFSDISALVALYRPGPMELIPQFIEGKHNPEKIVYPHPSLKPILEETYGIMVYQEQVMEIVSFMAGYSLGEADVIRRAMGKKKMSILTKNKKRFIAEAAKRDYEVKVSEKVWGFIEAFANYGFNKAHAASYAMISYQNAYLKSNYPVEYMTALMSIESGSHSMGRDEKIALAIDNCKKMGIIILPPDINKSDDDFAIEENENSLEGLGIRFGFNAIKNVGSAAIENILETRQKLGSFSTFTQFLTETEGRKVNKRVVETLIKVGAFDTFSTRASMLENLDSIRDTASQFQIEIEGQDSLFTNIKMATSAIQDSFPKLDEYPRQELLSFEKELLGLYLTDHPMAKALTDVAARATKQIGDLDHSIHQGRVFWFGGIITQIREVLTKKKQQPMAFGRLEDNSGSIEFVVFPRTYEQSADLCKTDQVILVKAKVEYREEELTLIIEKIMPPANPVVAEAERTDVELFIPRKTTPETMSELGALLKKNLGDQSISVLIPNGHTNKKMLLPYKVNWTKKLQKQAEEMLED